MTLILNASAGEGMLVDITPKSLNTLAELVGGSVIGDRTVQVTSAAPLYEVAPGKITLIDGDTLPEGVDCRLAAAAVVKEPIDGLSIPQIVVENPHEAFARICQIFLPLADTARTGPSSLATIDSTATIGEGCQLAPGVVIGAHVKVGARTRLMPGVVLLDHAEIGEDCVVFPNVTLYERTKVGKRVTIHAGTVLGAYGFGYRSVEGRHQPTAQLGHVVIEDDVELGAGVTIDRGTYGSTRIGQGTKIDDQVMIGHNCQIGKHNLICSQVGIAGSSRTGDHVVLAGQVGLKDHITLGDGAIVGAQSGVMEDLPGGNVYLGSPATTQREQMQIMAVERRLPELRRTLKNIQKAISKLEASREDDVTEGVANSELHEKAA